MSAAPDLSPEALRIVAAYVQWHADETLRSGRGQAASLLLALEKIANRLYLHPLPLFMAAREMQPLAMPYRGPPKHERRHQCPVVLGDARRLDTFGLPCPDPLCVHGEPSEFYRFAHIPELPTAGWWSTRGPPMSVEIRQEALIREKWCYDGRKHNVVRYWYEWRRIPSVVPQAPAAEAG